MSKKIWRDNSEKTFHKGRRPRRRLTAEGRKAVRRLRVIMVLCGVFFGLLALVFFQNQPGKPEVVPVFSKPAGG